MPFLVTPFDTGSGGSGSSCSTCMPVTNFTAPGVFTAVAGVNNVDVTAAPATVNLPAGVSGQFFVVKDQKGNSLVNNITVVASGGETFDGVAGPYLINVNFNARQFIFNGTDWTVM